MDRDRAYLLFFDYKGRETSRQLDPGASSGSTNPITLRAITAKMHEIVTSRPIGRPRHEILRRETKSGDVKRRRTAVHRARHLGTEGTAAVPWLLDTLEDPDIIVRHNAIQSLGELGAHAKAALPDLDELGRNRKGTSPTGIARAARAAARKIRSAD